VKCNPFLRVSSLPIRSGPMAAAQGEPIRRRGPRPAARFALGLVVALLVVAALAGLVAVTLAADDRRSERAPWARPGAPDVRPQPLDEQ
jgi:hypothetical protein